MGAHSIQLRFGFPAVNIKMDRYIMDNHFVPNLDNSVTNLTRCIYMAFLLAVLHGFVSISMWIITFYIETVGGIPSKQNVREGVYVDPSYIRISPRKKRPGLFPSSPFKGGDGPTPPKHGRQQKYHPGRGCGDCTVWLQLGSPATLAHKHSTKSRAYHVGEDNVVSWIEWLQKGGKNIL